MLRRLVNTVLFLFMSCAAFAAATLTEYQTLSFGEMAITGSNSDILTISPDNSESHGPEITPLLLGHGGVLRFTGFPASTIVSTLADNSTLNRQPSGASFDIGNFTFDPDADHQVTDMDGNMTLKIGATLTKRANTTYDAGPYRGSYNLMVNY